MAKEYFPFTGKIPFEGKESKNVMAFHYYDPEKVVMGKKMKDWLKFAMAWWHTLGGASGDQFGGQTRSYEWDKAADAVQRAKDKMDAGFEIMDKLGIEYFCFHDIDLVEEGDTIAEYEARMKLRRCGTRHRADQERHRRHHQTRWYQLCVLGWT